jgi:uncharacterized protein YbjQ (UPF0145 family)
MYGSPRRARPEAVFRPGLFPTLSFLPVAFCRPSTVEYLEPFISGESAHGNLPRQPSGNKEQQPMIITTTPSLDGKRISAYLGVVTGEAIVGANLFRDLFAGITDIVGGRSGAYEKELRRAREIAFEELTTAAGQLGANAVVGVDIDYEVLGERNGMLMVSVSGTAVKTE